MKTSSRPQYHRLQRILETIREGSRCGRLPNCRHFRAELEVSRRTLMRDLDFLRDDHRAPLSYDVRRGFHLTDASFTLAPVQLSQREVFSFSIARKLLERHARFQTSIDRVIVRMALAKFLRSKRERHP